MCKGATDRLRVYIVAMGHERHEDLSATKVTKVTKHKRRQPLRDLRVLRSLRDLRDLRVLRGFLVVLLFVASVAQAQSPAPLRVPYRLFKLDNRLAVILHQDKSVPVLSVNVWYHVGSA